MQHTIDRPRTARGGGHADARRRWGRGRSAGVMLVTFDNTRFHADAVELAVDTAVESGRVLVDVDVVDHINAGDLVHRTADLVHSDGHSVQRSGDLTHRDGQTVQRGGDLTHRDGQTVHRTGNRAHRAGHLVHRDAPLAPPGEAESLRAPAELAASLGVRVERFLLYSPRPVSGLLDLVAARRPALLVFGPDPAALRRFLRPTRRRYRRFVSTLEREAPCLLWTPQELDDAGAAVSAARPSAHVDSAPMRRAGRGDAARAGRGSAGTVAPPAGSRVPTTKGKRS